MTDHENGNVDKQKQPENIWDGNIKASIWRNEGESGVFHSVTFARVYEDRDGNPRDAHGFSGTDVLKVSELARQAYNKSRVLERDERRAAFKDDRKESQRGPRQNRDR